MDDFSVRRTRLLVPSAPFLYNSTFNMAKTSQSKKAVGIVSKPNKPEVAEIVPGLADWLRRNTYEFIVDPETSPYAPGIETVSRVEMGSRQLNFVIVLGGDGTLLSAA